MTTEQLVQWLESLDLDPEVATPLIARIKAEGATDELKLQALTLVEQTRDLAEVERDLTEDLGGILEDQADDAEAVSQAAADEVDRIARETDTQLDVLNLDRNVQPAPAGITNAPTAAIPTESLTQPVSVPAAQAQLQEVSPTPAPTQPAPATNPSVDWLGLLNDLDTAPPQAAAAPVAAPVVPPQPAAFSPVIQSAPVVAPAPQATPTLPPAPTV